MAQQVVEGLSDQLKTEILYGNVEAVKLLYYESADSAQQARLLADIAKWAARKAKVDILEWCFSAGLRIPEETLNNDLYHEACFAHSIAVWNVLLAHGFDLNGHHSEYCGDALSLEMYHNNLDLIHFLLENGQDPNSAWGYNDQELGVLALRNEQSSLDVLRLLLRHGWSPKESGTHICAAELGKMDALRLLVENGADLEMVDGWWFNPTVIEGDRWGTALYRAAYKGQEEPVVYLLDIGANPAFTDKKGRSCLWAARQGGNENIVKLLDERGIKQ